MLTAEQRALRKGKIGGSDAAVIAGVSPYKGVRALYHEFIGEVAPSDDETRAQYFGTLMEPVLRQAYMDRTKRAVLVVPPVISQEYDWLMCSPDGAVFDDLRGEGLLELKNLNAHTQIYSIADIPDHYYIQVQHNLKATGYEWGSLYMLIGGQDDKLFDLERDEATIMMLMDLEKEFLRRVQLKDPPPVDGLEATQDLLKRLHPKSSGRILTLDSPEDRTIAQALIKAKALLKKQETETNALEAAFKFKMGDAAECRIPGVCKITWKSTRERESVKVDVEQLKRRFPEAYKACATEGTAGGERRFVVTAEKEKAA
jgi:putative phage-type endonuclease